MREPRPAGTPVDARRYQGWLREFEGYRHQVTRGRIEDWLNQFQPRHQDLAARALDCVDFIGSTRIDAAYRQLLSQIPGWNRNRDRRSGEWRFVPFSASAGESGDAMIHRFRRANNLQGHIFNELFIHPRDLFRAKLQHTDTVVFVDDFSGSGNQVIKNWTEVFAELLPDGPTVYLILIAAPILATQRIAAETSINVICDISLQDGDNVFSDRCVRFASHDKQLINEYCTRVDGALPAGFGNCGLLVVFAHDCPNNSIPILHRVTANWTGLFPRNS